MTQIIVIDTETTGLDPTIDRVLEVATMFVDIDEELSGMMASRAQSTLVSWSDLQSIPPEASAVHHLTLHDLHGAPTYYPALDKVGLVPALDENQPPIIICAHNAAFDLSFLPQLASLPYICTWRCALHLYPDAPSHSNQALRYALPGVSQQADILLRALSLFYPPAMMAPHRALYDVVVTACILTKMLETLTVDDLLRLTLAPALLHKVRFGKHVGSLWSQVPLDYLSWILRQTGPNAFDSDVRYTAQHYLQQRG